MSIKPPDYLSEAEKEKFNSVVSERQFAKSDIDLLAMYCVAFCRWRAAEKAAAFAIANKAIKQVLKIGDRLALWREEE